MSSSQNTAGELSTPIPEYLSAEAAARLAGLPDARRVARNVAADAWEVGPSGKRWPLYTSETIKQWAASGIRRRTTGGAE